MNDPETQETIGKNPKQRLTKQNIKNPENINDEQHGEPRVNFFYFLSDAHCVTNIVNSDKIVSVNKTSM